MRKIREFLIDEEVLDSDIECLFNQMESLRQECFVNLSINEMQKKDYLKLTFELGSCLEKIIVENNLEELTLSFASNMQKNRNLCYYDFREDNFWKDVGSVNPAFCNLITNFSAIVLGNKFSSLNQSYHVLQSVKYLTIEEDSHKDFVYYTISPVNSIAMNYRYISEKEMHNYLLKITGLNNVYELEGMDILREFINSQGFYTNVPVKLYSRMKEKFPFSKLTSNSTMVIFDNEIKKQENLFTEMERFLHLNFGSRDDTITSSIQNLRSSIIDGSDVIEEGKLRRFINDYNKLIKLLDRFNINGFYRNDINAVDARYSQRIKRDKPKIEKFYNQYKIIKNNLSQKENSEILNKLKEYEYICYVWGI